MGDRIPTVIMNDASMSNLLSKSKRGWCIKDNIYTGRTNSLSLLASNIQTLPQGTSISPDQVAFLLVGIQSVRNVY